MYKPKKLTFVSSEDDTQMTSTKNKINIPRTSRCDRVSMFPMVAFPSIIMGRLETPPHAQSYPERYHLKLISVIIIVARTYYIKTRIRELTKARNMLIKDENNTYLLKN